MDMQELLLLVEKKHGKNGRDVVEKAHALMKKAHEGQYRIEGPAYHTHPEAVACILAEQGHTEPELIAAALMHDVVEDTKYTLAHITEEFGETIAFLVDGVTDFGKGDGNTEIPDKYERMQHTQKKILAYGQKDNRIFLIKIADRIHNLQTLNVLPKDKQARIRKQSQEFHTKLAEDAGEERFVELLDDLLQSKNS